MHTCPANAVDVDASFEFVNQIMGAEKGFFFFWMVHRQTMELMCHSPLIATNIITVQQIMVSNCKQ